MRHLNALKMHAASMDASAPVARWGLVTSADTSSMTVKVLLQPEGVQTDWLPLASSVVGAGWGLIHLPPVGTQVFCIPDAGDDANYVVIGATWSAATRPPAGVAQGELWLVHSSGSKIQMTNDGHLTIADAGGCSLAFNNNGTATLAGNLLVTGDITDQNGTHGTLAALRSVHNTHTHVEHGTGGGITSATTSTV